jgi:AcrR family transcriptional regulator
MDGELVTRLRKATSGRTNSRELLLDITERLMLEEGYAAVTTRRVAKVASLTSAAVHYYFPTTDDLLVALYRRTTETNFARLSMIVESDRPLHAMWQLGLDPQPTALALEFMALANHRKIIQAEIARYAEYSRGFQTGLMARILGKRGLDVGVLPPAAAALVLAGIYRILVMENGLDIHSGHEEARTAMERLINWLEPSEAS